MPAGGGSSFTSMPGRIPAGGEPKERSRQGTPELVRPGDVAEKVTIVPDAVAAAAYGTPCHGKEEKTRKCPKAKSYGSSVNAVISSNWDSKQLKVDYKTTKDSSVPAFHCTYTYPLGAAAGGDWSAGEFHLKSDTLTAKLVPRTSLELALHSKGTAAGNWLAEKVPDLDLTAGVVLAEAERSRKAYVKAKYKVNDAVAVGGQLTFTPESAAGGDGQVSPRVSGSSRLFNLSQSKVTASYVNSLVNVGAAMQGLDSVDVDFSCSPSAWAARHPTAGKVPTLDQVRGQANVIDRAGEKLHTAFGEDLQVYVGGKTSYDFSKGLGNLQAAAALNRKSGGHVSLTVNNVLGERPDYCVTTTADVGDWTLAAKLNWKLASGQSTSTGGRPSSFVVGAACKLEGGAKLRFRVNEEGVFGISYAKKLPKDNMNLSLVMESSPKDVSELQMPRVGICLKIE